MTHLLQITHPQRDFDSAAFRASNGGMGMHQNGQPGMPSFSMGAGTSFFISHSPHPGIPQMYGCMPQSGPGAHYGQIMSTDQSPFGNPGFYASAMPQPTFITDTAPGPFFSTNNGGFATSPMDAGMPVFFTTAGNGNGCCFQGNPTFITPEASMCMTNGSTNGNNGMMNGFSNGNGFSQFNGNGFNGFSSNNGMTNGSNPNSNSNGTATTSSSTSDRNSGCNALY